MAGKKLTDAQIDKIIRLFEVEKLSTYRIAKRMSAELVPISMAGVDYVLLRNGIDPWRRRHCIGQGQHNPFRPDEDTRMLQLRCENMPLPKIAKTMGRAITSIRIRILTLEARAENAMEQAA